MPSCVSLRLSFSSLPPFGFVAGVGKSCLLLRFSDDSFTTSFITTIGYVYAYHRSFMFASRLGALHQWVASSLHFIFSTDVTLPRLLIAS